MQLARKNPVMVLEIDHPEVETLLQELVRLTGESVPQAVLNSLKERLEHEKAKRNQPISVKTELMRIGRECAILPILDSRTADEILEHD